LIPAPFRVMNLAQTAKNLTLIVPVTRCATDFERLLVHLYGLAELAVNPIDIPKVREGLRLAEGVADLAEQVEHARHVRLEGGRLDQIGEDDAHPVRRHLFSFFGSPSYRIVVVKSDDMANNSIGVFRVRPPVAVIQAESPGCRADFDVWRFDSGDE
jgi:hypothetical protein